MGWIRPLKKKIHMAGFEKYFASSRNGAISQKNKKQVPMEIIELVWGSTKDRLLLEKIT